MNGLSGKIIGSSITNNGIYREVYKGGKCIEIDIRDGIYKEMNYDDDYNLLSERIIDDISKIKDVYDRAITKYRYANMDISLSNEKDI